MDINLIIELLNMIENAHNTTKNDLLCLLLDHFNVGVQTSKEFQKFKVTPKTDCVVEFLRELKQDHAWSKFIYIINDSINHRHYITHVKVHYNEIGYYNPRNIVENWKIILTELGQQKYAIDIEEAAQLLLPMHWPGLRFQSFKMLNQAEKEYRAKRINELLFVNNVDTTHRFIIRSLFLRRHFFAGVDSYLLNHPINNPRQTNNNDIELDKIDQLTNSFSSFHAVKNIRNELHHPNSFGLGHYANQIQVITSCLYDLKEIGAADNLILDYSQFLPNLKMFPLQKSVTKPTRHWYCWKKK